MELITIKRFDNLIEAQMMKSKLESENITCFLFDQNMVGLNPLFNVTLGGIKLKVKKSDTEKATEIIEEILQASHVDDKGETVKCPHCGYEEVYSDFKSMKGVKGILSAIVSFLFLVFPIYYKNVYKCKSCGKEFK